MSSLLKLYPGDGVALVAANALVQALVVFLLAWAAARLFARRNAALRYALYLAALVAMVAGPVTAWAADRAGLSLARIPLPAAASAESSETPGVPRGSTPIAEEMSPPLTPDRVPSSAFEVDPVPTVEPVPVAPAAARATATPEVEPSPAEASAETEEGRGAPPAGLDLLRALFAALAFVWAAGALYMLARLIHGWGVLAALRAGLEPLDAARHRQVLEAVRAALGGRKLPPIHTSLALGSPISAGLLRPAVLLPRRVPAMLTAEELTDVLVHECAHVLQRDHLVNMLQRLAAVIYWPLPAVHVLNRRLAAAREELCDNHVLRRRDPRAYARCLVSLAEKTTVFQRMPATVGLVHPRWRMEERIRGIVARDRRLVTRMNTWALAGVAAVFLATGVVVAGCKVGCENEESPNAAKLLRQRVGGVEFNDYELGKAFDTLFRLDKFRNLHLVCDPEVTKGRRVTLKMRLRPMAEILDAILAQHPDLRVRYQGNTVAIEKRVDESSAMAKGVAIPAENVSFHLVAPEKEKRSGLYAMPGLARWRDFPALEGLFAKAASGKLGSLKTGVPGVWLVGKLPWRVTSSNFFVPGEGKILWVVPGKYRKKLVGGIGAGGVKVEEPPKNSGVTRITIPVKFAHYRGPLGGKAGELRHAYVLVRLPALSAGRYRAELHFRDYAYVDFHEKQKAKLTAEAERPQPRKLACEFEVRAGTTPEPKKIDCLLRVDKHTASALHLNTGVRAHEWFSTAECTVLRPHDRAGRKLLVYWDSMRRDLDAGLLAALKRSGSEVRVRLSPENIEKKAFGVWERPGINADRLAPVAERRLVNTSDPDFVRKLGGSLEAAGIKWRDVGSGRHLLAVAEADHARARAIALKLAAGNSRVRVEPERISWGQAAGGVRAGISPTRIVLGRDDSDIRFRLWYENTGSKPASVWLWEETAGEVFDVAHGMELKVRLAGKSDTWHAMASCPEDMGRRPKALKPGERVSQMIVLPVRVTQCLRMPRIGGKPAVVSAIAWPPREAGTKVQGSPRVTGAVEVVRVASVPGTAWGFRGSKLPCVGLSAGSATLSANRPVDFTVHVRNSGSERARKVAGGLRSRLDWGLAFVPLKGGQAYVARNTVVDKMSRKLPAPFELRPGQSVAVHLGGGGWRFYPAKREKFVPLPYKFEPSRTKPGLPPGKYAVSACFPPPSGRGRNWRPQAVTGKVTVEVVAAKKPAPKISWGKAVNGLQVGLSLKRTGFEVGKPVELTLHLKNQGRKLVKVYDAGWRDNWTVKFGRYRGLGTEALKKSTHEIRSLEIAAGGTATVQLTYGAEDSRFYRDAPGGMKRLPHLPPGRYPVTAAYWAGRSAPKGHWRAPKDSPEVTTGSVEIEVVAANKPAPKVSWGQEAGGVRAGLSVKQTRCESGTPMKLALRLSNTGREPLELRDALWFPAWSWVFTPIGEGAGRRTPLVARNPRQYEKRGLVDRLEPGGVAVAVSVNASPVGGPGWKWYDAGPLLKYCRSGDAGGLKEARGAKPLFGKLPPGRYAVRAHRRLPKAGHVASGEVRIEILSGAMTVTDLLRDPAKYHNQRVTVSGRHRWNFEVSELEPGVWLKIDARSTRFAGRPADYWKESPDFRGARVQATGTFRAAKGKRYGYMKGYRCELVCDELRFEAPGPVAKQALERAAAEAWKALLAAMKKGNLAAVRAGCTPAGRISLDRAALVEASLGLTFRDILMRMGTNWPRRKISWAASAAGNTVEGRTRYGSGGHQAVVLWRQKAGKWLLDEWHLPWFEPSRIAGHLKLAGTDRITVTHAPRADFDAKEVLRAEITDAAAVRGWLVALDRIPAEGPGLRVKMRADVPEKRIEFFGGGKRLGVLRTRAGRLDAPLGKGWDFYKEGTDRALMKLVKSAVPDSSRAAAAGSDPRETRP